LSAKGSSPGAGTFLAELTAEDCAAACLEAPGCVSFDYGQQQLADGTTQMRCYPGSGVAGPDGALRLIPTGSYQYYEHSGGNCSCGCVAGCTDEFALNYAGPAANLDDSSCLYRIAGCTDPAATNHLPAANADGAGCAYRLLGRAALAGLNASMGFTGAVGRLLAASNLTAGPVRVDGCHQRLELSVLVAGLTLVDNRTLAAVAATALGVPPAAVMVFGGLRRRAQEVSTPQSFMVVAEAAEDISAVVANASTFEARLQRLLRMATEPAPAELAFVEESVFVGSTLNFSLPFVGRPTLPSLTTALRDRAALAAVLPPGLRLEPAGVELLVGCTHADSINYDPTAELDDGGCVANIWGCIDPTAFNFMPEANRANTSACLPWVDGCTDPAALNWNPAANDDDGSCIQRIWGCMDAAAPNFDPAANSDDGRCAPYAVVLTMRATGFEPPARCLAIAANLSGLPLAQLSLVSYRLHANTSDLVTVGAAALETSEVALRRNFGPALATLFGLDRIDDRVDVLSVVREAAAGRRALQADGPEAEVALRLRFQVSSASDFADAIITRRTAVWPEEAGGLLGTVYGAQLITELRRRVGEGVLALRSVWPEEGVNFSMAAVVEGNVTAVDAAAAGGGEALAARMGCAACFAAVSSGVSAVVAEAVTGPLRQQEPRDPPVITPPGVDTTDSKTATEDEFDLLLYYAVAAPAGIGVIVCLVCWWHRRAEESEKPGAPVPDSPVSPLPAAATIGENKRTFQPYPSAVPSTEGVFTQARRAKAEAAAAATATGGAMLGDVLEEQTPLAPTLQPEPTDLRGAEMLVHTSTAQLGAPPPPPLPQPAGIPPPGAPDVEPFTRIVRLPPAVGRCPPHQSCHSARGQCSELTRRGCSGKGSRSDCSCWRASRGGSAGSAPPAERRMWGWRLASGCWR
jgi:hypothetical protein